MLTRTSQSWHVQVMLALLLVLVSIIITPQLRASSESSLAFAATLQSSTQAANTATLTIILDTIPDATTDVNFNGSLGDFALDDDSSLPNSDATYDNTSIGSVASGVVSQVSIITPVGYFLTGVSCDSPNALAEPAFSRVRMIPQVDEAITCTFVVSQAAQISVVKYEDTDANGVQNGAEGRLADWRFYAFSGASFTPLADQSTNSGGLATLANIQPGVPRTVCEALATVSAFANTEPGAIDLLYNLPCKRVTLLPAQWLAIRFGNVSATGNDIDGDRIADLVDNCVYRANPTQIDSNGNDVGDVCESTLVIVHDSVPDSDTDFAYTGDLGWFVVDDDNDPTLPNMRSFGIETGSTLGDVTTAVVQTPYAQWPLDSLSCEPTSLATVNAETGEVRVTPGTPGTVITCTFVNSRTTRAPAEVANIDSVSLSPMIQPDRSVIFYWIIPESVDVAGVDIYISDRLDGQFQPLFLNMPVAASGNAVEQSSPPGTWYYILSVRQTSGEPLTDGPLSPLSPTVIEPLSFEADAMHNGTVRLTWETASELQTAGFNLYRSATAEEPQMQLNDELIAATGVSGQGALYELIDTTVTAGTWWYFLEDVTLDGVRTQTSPVMVVVNVPTVVTLSHMATWSTVHPGIWLFVIGLGTATIVGQRRRFRQDHFNPLG